MPLNWIISLFMLIFVMLMLIEMFSYKNVSELEYLSLNISEGQMFYQW